MTPFSIESFNRCRICGLFTHLNDEGICQECYYMLDEDEPQEDE